MGDEDSVLRQPLGELMKREISADFLKKELTLPDFLKKDLTIPEFFKKEIRGGILDKEIHLRRQKPEVGYESPVVQLLTCGACGKQTPSTVNTCLNCGEHIDAAYMMEDPRRYEVHKEDAGPRDLIDLAEEIL